MLNKHSILNFTSASPFKYLEMPGHTKTILGCFTVSDCYMQYVKITSNNQRLAWHMHNSGHQKCTPIYYVFIFFIFWKLSHSWFYYSHIFLENISFVFFILFQYAYSFHHLWHQQHIMHECLMIVFTYTVLFAFIAIHWIQHANKLSEKYILNRCLFLYF